MVYNDIKDFYASYKQRKCVIGYSFQGREIFAFHTGESTGKQFISVYAVHAREWITAYLAVRHLKIGTSVGGWIIPLLNPDGAQISQTKYPLWKANARGVDLNCNFDAEWGTGRLNTRVRSGENCIGDYPFSETETLALKNFTERVHPAVTLSWHTKGEEIYWLFGGKGDLAGAELLSAATGYRHKIIYGSAGGYKDWCLSKLDIPSYTIECGSDSLNHPIKKLSRLKPCFQALRYFTDHYAKPIVGKR